MAYKVKIDSFEGPFDLLLYLVSRKKVDIGAVPVARIADQYLEEVRELGTLDLDTASDFLLVAATLLEMKASALLPRQRDEVAEEVAELAPSEARDILVERLVEYKQFKNAANELSARYEATSRMHPRPFGPDRMFLKAMPDFLKGATIEQLGTLAAEAMARREIFLLESEHIAAKPIPVESHVRSIHERLVKEKHVRFSEILAGSRSTQILVVSFLAVLELYKRGMAELRQDELFGDIQIDYIEGSGELIFEDEETQKDEADD